MKRQTNLFDRNAADMPLFSGSPIRAQAEAFNPEPAPVVAHTRSFLEDDAGSYRVALRHTWSGTISPLSGTYDSFAAAFSRALALQERNRDRHYEYVVQEVAK